MPRAVQPALARNSMCAQVSLKLVDKLTLYGTALGAVVAGATAFWGANVELSYILSTLGIMGGKLFQVRPAPLSAVCSAERGLLR